MDGAGAKKSTSFETLVIQNISNVNDLKTKLHEIISAGKEYEYDVSSCLKSLLKSSDRDIVLLAVQAISELAKCEEKREIYANKDIINPILDILRKGYTKDSAELVKQSCRALGNLCCDCDAARNVILESNGVSYLVNLLKSTMEDKPSTSSEINEIKKFASKTLLNFAIGGQEFSDSTVQGGLIEVVKKMLTEELDKEDMSDENVSTALLILSVMNDNTPEYLFDPEINSAVLNVLRETSNVEISELCLEHLHTQAEHDSVKTLLANEGGMQLVCTRLELVLQQHEGMMLNAEDSEVVAVVKQACDLIIIVLTGDEAMHILYDNGHGDVFTTMVRWLDSSNPHLVTTAVLAIGNFARQDDYCSQMMKDRIFDKLLDIFEAHKPQARDKVTSKDGESEYITNSIAITKIQHAVLSAIRNLLVPVANKKTAASEGRAAPILLDALPNVEDHHVAYKLLAAIRMLVDGQEEVAVMLCTRCGGAALRAVATWGSEGGGGGGGAGGEAPRLLAWSAKILVRGRHIQWQCLLKEEGCIMSLVNMLVVCHSVMQNEAILALTLLGIECLKPQNNPEDDCEKAFISQLIKSEIGKHVSVLIETNCAKMPLEVADNLLTFLNVTSKKNEIASDFKEAKVHESLQKFLDTRNDLSDDMRNCARNVIATVSDNGKD